MAFTVPPAVQAIIASATVSADDVLTLRRLFYANGAISPDEAECLFAVNAAARLADESWDCFFVEALTDFCVYQVEPQGYVTDDKAAWLIGQITRDGAVESARELELIVSILQKSTSSPPSLAAFALKTVRDCVLSGSGPLRGRQKDFRPKVCDHDATLLRRAIFAFGAGGNVSVTREEADLLCDINDATAHASNDPAWPDLFAKAIGNHLMMAATFTPADADASAKRDRWLDDQSTDVGGFLGRMAQGLRDAFGSSGPSVWDAREDQRNRAIAAAASILDAEAGWLADRLGRDGTLSPAEIALLRFLKANGVSVHHSLQPLLAQVA